MIKLHARLSVRRDAEPFVVRIATPCSEPCFLREKEAFLAANGAERPSGYRAYLAVEESLGDPDNETQWVIPEALRYLSAGDIVRISPRSGEIWVMYRRTASFNALLLTEQCNSHCIMCSQPPKEEEDRHLVEAYLQAIPLMAAQTPELCITGGEPTLLGDALFEVIRACRNHLPNTAIHMLSNGRMFNYLSLCQELAAIEHPDLMIGIPLYSDIAHRHDFVVQAEGAFDQTIRGIMNLARCRQRVEIRLVLHRETIHRLPQFAHFIARNLPFVSHVALMGLEMMGYVRMNLDALWIDPLDYQTQLVEAVDILERHGLFVSIYNLPLCVLDPHLWPIARQSISDWKNEYLDECRGCAVREQCGGFFTSSSIRRSRGIHAVSGVEFGNAEVTQLTTT